MGRDAPLWLWATLWQLSVVLSGSLPSTVEGEWVFQDPVNRSYLAAWANSTFRSAAPHDLDFLRNISVVFLGDSVTRYQFMYLAQYVHLRLWDDVYGNSLYSERPYQTFGNMYRGYTGVFGCSHICDCADHHLMETTVVRHGKVEHHRYQSRHLKIRTENHYYRHGQLDARLTFHLWNGGGVGMTFYREAPTAGDFARYCGGFPGTAQPMLNPPLEPKHSFPSVAAFIRDVLASKGHRVLVVNYGIWKLLVPNNTVLSESNLDALAAAAHAVAPIVVWRTTTAVMAQVQLDDPALLAGLRQRGFLIFDAYRLTRELPPLEKAAMWDGFHFEPFVYRELNIAFLEFLRDALAGRPPHDRNDTAAAGPGEEAGAGSGADPGVDPDMDPGALPDADSPP